VRFPSEAAIATYAVVAALYGEGMGFALEVPAVLEDDSVRMPEVGAEGNVSAARKRRT